MSTDDDSKARRRATPIGDGTTLHITIPDDIAAGIDTHLDEMRGMQPDTRVTRSDAARAILRRGLAIVERRKADRGRER